MTRHGFLARIHAILHKVRHPSHVIKWKTGPDWMCPGDIVCETCDMVIWCRVYDMCQEELLARITRVGL